MTRLRSGSSAAARFCALFVSALCAASIPGTAGAQTPASDDEQADRYDRLFPIGAQAAIDRGYDVQLPYGISLMLIDSGQRLRAGELAVALAKDGAPGPDVSLQPVPFVVPTKIRSDTIGPQARLDLWVLPFLNLFVSLGRVKGDVEISVDIDLDAVFPFPICRPANPCGTRTLDFTADADNTTTTFGALAVYGARTWFVAGTAAKTISVSSKERSDIETLNAAVRLGPRIRLGDQSELMPYAGVNYFKLDTTLTGVVTAADVFPDGGDLSLSYRTELSNPKRVAGVIGGNLVLSDHWQLQAEHERSGSGHRSIASLTYRF